MFDAPLSIQIPPGLTVRQEIVVDKPIAFDANTLTFTVDNIWYELVGVPFSFNTYPIIPWTQDVP
jgi:hypothetical protein